MAWDEYGVWKGSVTQENGEWLIGDQLPLDHPGHVAADDPRGLMVKYWTASQHDPSHKYCGRGHEPPLPAHGGRFEFVQVLRGWFCCRSRNVFHHLGGPASTIPNINSIDLPALTPRCWYLGSAPWAWGVTLCRWDSTPPPPSSSRSDYAYSVLDSMIVSYSWLRTYLSRVPRRPTKWDTRLIMAFRGVVSLSVDGLGVLDLVSENHDYAYTRYSLETTGEWHANGGRTVVAMVYY